MKKQRSKVYKTLSIVLIMLLGTVLYLLLQGDFSQFTQQGKSQTHTEYTKSDKDGNHLKLVKHNYTKFAKQPLVKQDQILQKTQSISVSKSEVAKKKKITDAMETRLDKHIISEISNLQGETQPLSKADELKQQIRKLHTLSADDKVQFIQEIQAAQQAMKN